MIIYLASLVHFMCMSLDLYLKLYNDYLNLIYIFGFSVDWAIFWHWLHIVRFIGYENIII